MLQKNQMDKQHRKIVTSPRSTEGENTHRFTQTLKMYEIR